MNNARKDGSLAYSKGKVDAELEGDIWDTKGPSMTLEGAASGGGSGAWGVSAGRVGGNREMTRNMGNTTTQTERGYSVLQQPWNMIDEGADIGVPNQQGELATGGTLNVATEGMDPQKLMLMGSMLGITKGPKGTSMGPGGTYGNGQFEMSDIMDWARAHPVLWSIAKAAGNLVMPGLPSVGQAALNIGTNIAARKNQPAAMAQ